MQEKVCIPKKEYEVLVYKSSMYDEVVEEEGFTQSELARLEKARLGKSFTEQEFLRRHPELR